MVSRSVILGTLLCAAVGHAMHGGGGALAVVVEAESATDGTGSRSCVMTGTVLNPNVVLVTVTLMWRGADASGNTLGFASARVARLPPSERRQFVSSPFLAPDGVTLAGCRRLARIERVETLGDPGPSSGAVLRSAIGHEHPDAGGGRAIRPKREASDRRWR